MTKAYDTGQLKTTTDAELALKAPLASPTFTGTVGGITKAMVGLTNVDDTSDATKQAATLAAATKADVGLGNVDNTADSAKPVSTAQQTALDLKANLTGAVFTGAITTTSTFDGRDVSVDGAKLDLIDDNANNYSHPNHTGDVTSTSDGATVIAANAVTNAKLAAVATSTIKGRVTAATGDPEDLTPAQVRTLLNVEDGATANVAATDTVAGIVEKSTSAENVAGTSDLVYPTVAGAKEILDTFGIQLSGNNTWTGHQTFNELSETVYSLTGTDIDPANGTIQYKTFAGNTTFTESLTAGQSVVLRMAAGGSYTITWPTMTWFTAAGNVAPTLTAADVVVLWKESTTLYGAYVGSAV